MIIMIINIIIASRLRITRTRTPYSGADTDSGLKLGITPRFAVMVRCQAASTCRKPPSGATNIPNAMTMRKAPTPAAGAKRVPFAAPSTMIETGMTCRQTYPTQ
jgi:hypothetical protein